MLKTMPEAAPKSRQIDARKNGAEKSDPHAGSASGEIRLPVRLDLADGTDSLSGWLQAYFAVEVTTAASSRAVQRRDLGRFLSFMQREEGSDDRALWTSRLSRAFFDALHKELDADGSRRFSDRTIARIAAHLKTFAKWIHTLRPFRLGDPTEKLRLSSLAPAWRSSGHLPRASEGSSSTPPITSPCSEAGPATAAAAKTSRTSARAERATGRSATGRSSTA
jgi:hypothetical protein